MSLMKAILIEKHGGTEALQHKMVPIPKVKEGHLLVKNYASGVNFVDIYQRTGLYKSDLPLILGREGSGIVEEVGPGVPNFRKGDHVAYLGSSTYAEYSLAGADHAIKLPEEISLRDGAGILSQGLTALSMLKYSYEVKKGDWILVPAAAGGTGLWLVQLGRAMGAHVIGATSSETKAEIAKNAGADHVIIYTKEDLVEKVRKLTPNGEGVHAVYDGVGQATFDTSLKCLRRLGTMVSFGNASGKVEPIDLLRLTEGNWKLLRPKLFNYIKTRDEFTELSNELFRLMKQNDIKIHITSYKLSDIQNAHNDLSNRKTIGKLVLQIQ
ncbi:uncharacterized protein VTP21DRAFT_6895 [Calcarisporiella thermophila]|uniref:uncharacterized protein n=1 Tax=Calcarisporiella thermophila TaxID=911321 RepID=UPI0037449203